MQVHAFSYETKKRSYRKIIDYYNATQERYNKFWMDNENLAMHLGYWDEEATSHEKSLIRLNEILGNMLRIGKSDFVLDAGCGVGGSSIWLAKNYGAKVIGISIVDLQVKLARRFAKEKKIGHLAKFARMDYSDTKFRNDTFDIIWSQESFCHSLNKKTTLQEMYRILKKSGQLVISDLFLYKDKHTKREVNAMQWTKGVAVPNLASINNFKEILYEVGFKGIACTDISKNVLPSSKRLYKLGKLYELGILSIDKKDSKFSILESNLRSSVGQYETLRDDIWHYCIFYAIK